MAKRLDDRRLFKGRVLTLRMSEEEMLKFRLAAISLGKKRAVIVRERVADLIGGKPVIGAITETAHCGQSLGDEMTGDDGEVLEMCGKV